MAMPPLPEAWSMLDSAQISRFNELRVDALNRGLDNPQSPYKLKIKVGIERDDPAETVLRIPVILIDFVDNAADQQNHSQQYFEALLFSEQQVETGSVRDFYAENSFGEIVISGEIAGWYRAPQNYAYYTNRQFGLGNYPRNAQKLAEDAIRAADEDLDYSRYDNDGDGFVDAPFIIHAGPGAEQDPNNVNLIWSHAWNVEALGELDGVRFAGYTTVPEDGKIGVFSHELGHALFGLPDLYDTRGESAGLGIWSVMAYGAWGGDGARPVHFDAWCKSRLGWIEVETIAWDRHATMRPAAISGQAFRLWNPENQGSEYFLAEYRDNSGFDGELPESGLLIFHVDEAMENNDHPFYPGNEGQLHDLVALEQADGDFDLEQFVNVGDRGDPFPGSSGNTVFDEESQPGSLDYDGQSTGIAVRDITISENGLTADWIVGAEGPADIEQRISLRAGWNLISLRVVPENVNVPDLVAPLVERNILRFVKDDAGRFYTPAHDFNNIPFWNIGSAYFLNLTEDGEITFIGQEIEFNRPIPLRNGWQAIAYYPEARISVERAFAGLGESLIMAKDGDGRFYYPGFGFSNMDLLSPGRGYLVKISGNREFHYPEE